MVVISLGSESWKVHGEIVPRSKSPQSCVPSALVEFVQPLVDVVEVLLDEVEVAMEEAVELIGLHCQAEIQRSGVVPHANIALVG